MNIYSLLSLLFLLFSFCFQPSHAIQPKDIPIKPCTINRQDQRTSNIALCAVFRDEGPWLREWIEYHRLIGVSHFYLYNNCSSDNFWAVLKPYVDQGIVELFDVPYDTQNSSGANAHNFVQVVCYNHAISLAKNYNKWLAIIDCDEFICPVADNNLYDALTRYDHAEGLAVYWQIYGTSNVWELKSNELLIEKLLLRYKNTGGNGMFKSIVKPQNAYCVDPHLCKFRGTGLMVLPNNQRFTHTPHFSQLPVDIIRINHYTFRTQHYYDTYKKPRRERWGDKPSPQDEAERLNGANAEYDPVMLKYVPELRKRMFNE